MAKKKTNKKAEAVTDQVTTDQTTTDQTTTDAPTDKATDQPAPPTPAPPEPAPAKKLSGTDFAIGFLCEHPDATNDELRAALAKAEIKMADSTLETWPPFMAKIFAKLDELGWKRPDA